MLSLQAAASVLVNSGLSTSKADHGPAQTGGWNWSCAHRALVLAFA